MLKWFSENFSDYVEDMKVCLYHHENGELNKHHLEGNVWAHTLLAYEYGVSIQAPKLVLWAVILHDIGRIFTREQDDETNKVYFYDFEGVSCFVALEILKKAKLSLKEQAIVLKIISYQYSIIDYIKYDSPTQEELIDMFAYDEETLHYLAIYGECDLWGRKVDENEFKHYKLDRIKSFIIFMKKTKKKNQESHNKKNVLYLLVGPPCSRKSTWLKSKKDNFLVLSRDSSMDFIGRKYNKNTFNEVYELTKIDESVKKEVSQHYHEVASLVKKSKNIDVVIDNPNLKKRHREEWIKHLGKTHIIEVVLFLNSFETLKNCDNLRYMSEGKHIGEEAILEKLIGFVYPLYSEDIDTISLRSHT
ncbi:AAA family ATPase [Sulfurimonas sp. SAG-AH-194-C21]|nr:AAA family ATPase [Sulfurimonas sp. SAG-AH-194-C21]MDF1883213.1 AAA family ATPase [Sulfurimonas sp. SAG-AH-194-C21]